jgi:hypothetical protein
MQFKEPTHCHLWQKGILTRDDLDFESIASEADDSHFERSVVRCRRCGQRYLFQFYELVNWRDGNDVMTTIYVPVEKDDTESLRTVRALDLAQSTPRLQWEGDTLTWVGR